MSANTIRISQLQLVVCDIMLLIGSFNDNKPQCKIYFIYWFQVRQLNEKITWPADIYIKVNRLYILFFFLFGFWGSLHFRGNIAYLLVFLVSIKLSILFSHHQYCNAPAVFWGHVLICDFTELHCTLVGFLVIAYLVIVSVIDTASFVVKSNTSYTIFTLFYISISNLRNLFFTANMSYVFL